MYGVLRHGPRRAQGYLIVRGVMDPTWIEEVLARLDPDGTRASIQMHRHRTATQHRTLGTTPDYAWTVADHENGVTSRLDHR